MEKQNFHSCKKNFISGFFHISVIVQMLRETLKTPLKKFRIQTHAAQNSSAALRTTIKNFHTKFIREGKIGTYTLKNLVNMDQTPLPLVKKMIQRMKKPALMKFG